MSEQKLYLGDSYKLIKEMPDNSIDLIVTDPPYEITTGGKDNTRVGQNIRRVAEELKDNKITVGINEEILEEFMRVMKVPNIYIWCNIIQVPQYIEFFTIKNQCKLDILVWQKTNAAPLYSNRYLTDKEYCLYFRLGGYCQPTSYQAAKTVFQQPANKKDKDLYGHPTIKPLDIIKTLISNSARKGDVVFDPFMGSGTAAVACKDLDLDFVGIEINEKWYKVAQDRTDDAAVGNENKNQTTIYDFF